MSEEFRGNAVQPHSGHEYQVETSLGAVSSGDLSIMRVSETVFLSELTLFPRYVLVTSEEQRSKDVQSCAW